MYTLLHMNIIGTFKVNFLVFLSTILSNKKAIAEFFSEFMVPSTSSRTISVFLGY